jgi:hypothetical protein
LVIQYLFRLHLVSPLDHLGSGEVCNQAA